MEVTESIVSKVVEYVAVKNTFSKCARKFWSYMAVSLNKYFKNNAVNLSHQCYARYFCHTRENGGSIVKTGSRFVR